MHFLFVSDTLITTMYIHSPNAFLWYLLRIFILVSFTIKPSVLGAQSGAWGRIAGSWSGSDCCAGHARRLTARGFGPQRGTVDVTVNTRNGWHTADTSSRIVQSASINTDSSKLSTAALLYLDAGWPVVKSTLVFHNNYIKRTVYFFMWSSMHWVSYIWRNGSS